MKPKLTSLFSLLLAVLALGLLAGCGSDDGDGGGSSDEDPQEVLEQAVGNETELDAATLTFEFDVTAEGDAGGSATVKLSGPFAAGEDGELPTLDWTLEVDGEAVGQSVQFTGNLKLVDGKAFVNYEGTDYEIDEATLEGFRGQIEAQSEAGGDEAPSLEQFGVDPATWFTDLSNEGTEDFDGDEVIKITGSLDVEKLFADLSKIAEETGQAAEFNQADIDEVIDAVETADFTLLADSETKLVRSLEGNLGLAAPEGDTSGVDSVAVDFSISTTDLGETPDVSAPDDAEPFTELLGAIGIFGVAGGVPGFPLGPDGFDSEDPLDSGGGDELAPPEEIQNCLDEAQSAEDAAACAELL